MGVGELSYVFMESIEVITSQEREVLALDERGRPVRLKEKVWNGTVASLTLMALGSSAPEILLNVVEMVGTNFYAGDLGPSTIVGSAAFNFCVIIAVCIVTIPTGEQRRIRSLSTFLVTMAFSLFAYAWMYITICMWTPDVITPAEAAITALCLPLLVFFAYQADIGAYGGNDAAPAEAPASGLPPRAQPAGMRRTNSAVRALHGVGAFDEAAESARLAAQMLAVRATHDPHGWMSSQQVADIAAVDIGLVALRSIAFLRGLSSGQARHGPLVRRRASERIAHSVRWGTQLTSPPRDMTRLCAWSRRASGSSGRTLTPGPRR